MKITTFCVAIGLLWSCSTGSQAQGKLGNILKGVGQSIKKELDKKSSTVSQTETSTPPESTTNTTNNKNSNRTAATGNPSREPIRWLGSAEEYSALLDAQFPNGLRETSFGTNRKGFVDRTGRFVIPPIYFSADVDVTETYMVLSRKANGKTLKTLFYTDGRRILSGEYDDVDHPVSGLIKVKQGDKAGFFGLSGKQVIPFLYDDNRYVSSYFAGDYGYVHKGGKKGVIDRTGRVIVPFGKYDYIGHFSGGVMEVGILKKGYITNPYYLKIRKVNPTLHYVDYLYKGVIDTTGRVIIDLKHYNGHDYLFAPQMRPLAHETYIIPEAKRIIIWSDVAPLVGSDGKTPHIGFAGVFDFNGKQIIPFAYQAMEYHANERSFYGTSAYGYGTEAIHDVNGKLLLKDNLGKEGADRTRAEMYAGARPVNLHPYSEKEKRYMSYWAVVDGVGNYIVQPTERYKEIREFLPSGRAWAKDTNEKWGMIDKTGRTVVAFKYDAVKEYKPYTLRKVEPQNYAGNVHMDVHGYRAYMENAHYFRGNYSVNQRMRSDEIVWRKELCPKYLAYVGVASSAQSGKTKWGLMDDNGNVIVEPRYDRIEDFDEGLAMVSNNKLLGMIDLQGKEVVAPQFAEIRRNGDLGHQVESSMSRLIQFSDEGVAIVRYPDKTYNLMNKQGRLMLDKNIVYHNQGSMVVSKGLYYYNTPNGPKWIDGKGRTIADFDNFQHSGAFSFIVRDGKVGVVTTSFLDPERKSTDPVSEAKLTLIDLPQVEYYMSGGRNRFSSKSFKAVYIDTNGNRTELSDKDVEFFLVGSKYMSARKLTPGVAFTTSTIYDGYWTYKGLKRKLRFFVYK